MCVSVGYWYLHEWLPNNGVNGNLETKWKLKLTWLAGGHFMHRWIRIRISLGHRHRRRHHHYQGLTCMTLTTESCVQSHVIRPNGKIIELHYKCSVLICHAPCTSTNKPLNWANDSLARVHFRTCSSSFTVWLLCKLSLYDELSLC